MLIKTLIQHYFDHAGVDLANLEGPLGVAGRSVSAAVSDESVAADSGVYEASSKW